ncbi:MAG: BatA domain-containing protein, partial [Flavobacteriaceae bacterium]
MTFLHPAYLWGLLGLLIPIAIHLWSKRKVQVIKVGSTKFITTMDPRQTNSLALNELWLLALRLLTITLVTLILAAPRLKKQVAPKALVYLVEPSLLADERFTPVLDTLPQDAVRLLEEGFPEFTTATEVQLPSDVPNYWQLAQKMEQLMADSIVVFTRALQSGLKGKRPEVNSTIQWVAFEMAPEPKKLLEAFALQDSLRLVFLTDLSPNLGFEAVSLAKV